MLEIKKHVLLIEDDKNFRHVVKNYLKFKNYAVTMAKNGKEGLKKYNSNIFDMILLDVMMPEKDGITLAKEIRKLDSHIPIIFLTAKSMEQDKIKGFNAGADDYLTKPFSINELIARMEAILRRTSSEKEQLSINEIQLGKLTFNYLQHKLTYENHTQKLTAKEADLLKLLCIKKNDTLERKYALKAIWGDDSYFNARSMDVFIARIRKYLSQDPNIEIISVPRKGFRLVIKPISS